MDRNQYTSVSLVPRPASIQRSKQVIIERDYFKFLLRLLFAVRQFQPTVEIHGYQTSIDNHSLRHRLPLMTMIRH